MSKKNDAFEEICVACKRTLPKDLRVYKLDLIELRETSLPFVSYEEEVTKPIQICPYCGTIKVVDHD